MGNVGFGHYTAYGKSVTDNNWYSFDDSHVSRSNPSQVVSNSAYSIFYRLRGFSDINNIDFKKIEKVPTEAYWKTVKKWEKIKRSP
jgi:ubiquitin carboxyl-terminal hydrolase 4/11/15